MKTWEYAGDPFHEPRSHPWVDTAGKPDCRYYDLTASPEHIRTSLEDFQPWSHYPAVEAFYALLEWLNQPNSPFESNDCAFEPPHPEADPSGEKALGCSGRIMLLFRALTRNSDAGVSALKDQLHRELIERDANFRLGAVGTTLVPVRYLALPGTKAEQLGSQLMISFWVWGNTETATMMNLARLMNNLSGALRVLSRESARSRS